jgi:hypothetical protein
MALTKDTLEHNQFGDAAIPPLMEYGVAADAVIFAGALVVRNGDGYAEPGSVADDLKALGRAEKRVDNTGGANGAKKVMVRRGVFPFKNSAAADAITVADIGEDCYIVDDETVAKTSDTNARSVAGKIEGIRADGRILVRVGV